MKRIIKNMVAKMKFNSSAVITILTGCLLLSGCKKLIEIDPPIERNTSETVYSNTNTAVSAMTGIYAAMNSAGDIFTDAYGLSIRTSLRCDELTPRNPSAYPDYTNDISENVGWSMWTGAYKDFIYRINSLLEGVEKSSLNNEVKSILSGEAKFTRAWIYFYLVNFYGDVPLVLTSDFKTNATISRSSKELVYLQIIKDLKEAQATLKDNYLDRDLITATQERIRPNKFAATALLSRVYLYNSKWAEAEAEASKVIDDSRYELLSDLNQVFIKNSREAIWQLQPNPLDPNGVNTPDGRYLINPRNGRPFFSLSNFVLNAFEPGDHRRDAWVTTSPSGMIIPFKYKEGWATMVQNEYTMVLRLSEQYLIRAEARARQGKVFGNNGSEADLNAVRSRAGLNASAAVNVDEMLKNIEDERQVEMFTEWGDRWLNLQRIGRLNDVMEIVAPLKGGTWAAYKALLPIPYDEFKFNPSLRGHQNPGYLEQP